MHLDKHPSEETAFDRALTHYMEALESFEAKQLINEFAERIRGLCTDTEIRHAYLEHRISAEESCVEGRDRDLLVAMLVGIKHYREKETTGLSTDSNVRSFVKTPSPTSSNREGLRSS